jgi:hypothetical protein
MFIGHMGLPEISHNSMKFDVYRAYGHAGDKSQQHEV